MYSLVPCEGGFLFVDFTLACCQPVILFNCLHSHYRCPSPVLGHHPFLVLDISHLLNCELQDSSCNIQCQRIHNWQRGKISILLQNCCLKPTRQVTRPNMINRIQCWLYENCDIAIAIFYSQLPATKPSTLVSLLCAQLRYGFLISVS